MFMLFYYECVDIFKQSVFLKFNCKLFIECQIKSYNTYWSSMIHRAVVSLSHFYALLNNIYY